MSDEPVPAGPEPEVDETVPTDDEAAPGIDLAADEVPEGDPTEVVDGDGGPPPEPQVADPDNPEEA